LNDTIEVLYCFWLTNENINGIGFIKALHANKTLQVLDFPYLSREILLALLDLAKSNENYIDFGLGNTHISVLIIRFSTNQRMEN
jgi:hypothetical protein